MVEAIRQLSPATLGALQKLGANLAVARLRRKESLRLDGDELLSQRQTFDVGRLW
jgi:hypothetical protein